MIKAVKGTRDLLPPSTSVWNHVEAAAREVFRTYNYQEIRTPIFEETALFVRGVGEDTDVVSKEMYTFEDRGGTSLTLRPEATASVIRAYIENHLDQIPGVKKYYYIGPMFRRERPQKGRYRQFFQIGAEAIGPIGPMDDAETIELVMTILSTLFLAGTRLLINTVGHDEPQCRPEYLASLRRKLQDVSPQMCSDCQRRSVTNPLRVFDCKVPQDQAIIATLPTITESVCDACKFDFRRVQELLTLRGIQYEVQPRLVRGLDYYRRTTFEVVHGDLGAQSAVLGGGQYDGIAESLGSTVRAPGVGFSIGEDRLVMLVEQSGFKPPNGPDVYVAYNDSVRSDAPDRVRDAAVKVTQYLRKRLRLSVELGNGRLRRSLELANKLGARYALILGDDEVDFETYTLKNLTSGIFMPNLTREDLEAKIESANN